eukprot:jgi/Bigna1/81984/fgenesh1_pg.86_\
MFVLLVLLFLLLMTPLPPPLLLLLLLLFHYTAERLGTPPDVVLLHSPEFFLTSREGVFKEGGSKRSREELFDAFYDRVEKAFVCLEDLVTGRPNLFEGPSLRRLLSRAEKAAAASSSSSSSTSSFTSCSNARAEDDDTEEELDFGATHRMRIAQIPLNLVESGPVLQSLFDPDAPPRNPGDEKGRFVTSIEVAESKGVSIVGNRPINAIPPEGIGAGDWGRGETYWKLINKLPMSPEMTLMRDTMLGAIHEDPEVSYADVTDMQLLALWSASSANGLTSELCGARNPHYVTDIKKVLSKPRLSPEACKRVFGAVRNLLIELSPGHGKLW